MEFNLLLKIPALLSQMSFRLGEKKQLLSAIRKQRRLQRTLAQMPEWQRKDLNLHHRDLKDYSQYL